MSDITKEYNELIRPVVISCKLFGCWPDRRVIDKTSTLAVVRHRCYTLFILVILVASVVFNLAELIHYWGEDMNATIECSLACTTLSGCIVRVCLLTIHQKDMLYIIETMKDDWTNSSVEQQALLKEKCLLPFKVAKYYAMTVIISSSFFGFVPYIETKLLNQDNNHKLPFGGYLYVNNSYSPMYEITYSISFLWGFVLCNAVIGATAFSFITIVHAAAKFYLVQNDFQTIASSNWMSQDKLGRCVRRHQESIKFADVAERALNLLALTQFILSTGMVCFGGFQITTMKEDRKRLMKYASYLMVVVGELYIFSYSGQKLLTESENVADCAFTSDWIGCDRSNNLNIVLMRSSKPCAITAGKFYFSCYPSFVKVMSTSFSYLTVLLAMKD